MRHAAMPPKNSRKCPWATAALNKSITEYTNQGVLERTFPQVAQATRRWSPGFGRLKADSGQIRTNTYLRELNTAWEKRPTFKTDN